MSSTIDGTERLLCSQCCEDDERVVAFTAIIPQSKCEECGRLCLGYKARIAVVIEGKQND